MVQEKSDRLIKRAIFSQVVEHLAEKEMTVVIGPRQVGKTTLLEQLQDYLINQKKIDPSLIHYFNLDLTTDLGLFSEQDSLIQFIKDRQSNNILYLFIDEVQRIINAGQFLKGIYDLGLNVKFILSGSSSLEIKDKIIESLTGRKEVFQLLPISFSEFINYRDNHLFEILSHQRPISAYDYQSLFHLVNEFCIFGGYPRVVTEITQQRKISLLGELYNSYIEKDVVNFLKIQQPVLFNKLVSILAGQASTLLNIHQLSNHVGVQVKTTLHYLDVLENTFVIKRITPFFSNPRKELTKMPKVYFLDNGIRNFGISKFEELATRDDRGIVYESTVATELIKSVKSPHFLHYWRSLQKAEVDFVVRKADGKLLPIEVKAQNLNHIQISRSFRSFLDKYNPTVAYLLNFNLRSNQTIKNTDVQAITLIDLNKLSVDH